MVPSNYDVILEDFAVTHYGKTFKKKYKEAWTLTLNEIKIACSHIDKMLEYKRADLINSKLDVKLVKLDFSIHGTKMSPKASGNRAILFVNEKENLVRILLIYSKNDICAPNETTKWKNVVFTQFPNIAKVFK